MSRTHKLKADNSDRFYQGIRYPSTTQFNPDRQDLPGKKVPYCQFCTNLSERKIETSHPTQIIYVCDEADCKDELATILILHAIKAKRRKHNQNGHR